MVGYPEQGGFGRYRGFAGVAATRVCAMLAAAVFASAASIAVGQTPKVVVTGGADNTAHNYSWTVRNEYTSPIVYVEFPHYHADQFFAPKGWTPVTTGLVGKPSSTGTGTCVATTQPADGIGPGESEEFGMRIAAVGAQRGLGNIRVRFANDEEISVPGVELPQPVETQMTFLPLIGLALIFGAVVVVRGLRRRRAALSNPAEPGDSPPDM